MLRAYTYTVNGQLCARKGDIATRQSTLLPLQCHSIIKIICVYTLYMLMSTKLYMVIKSDNGLYLHFSLLRGLNIVQIFRQEC